MTKTIKVKKAVKFLIPRNKNNTKIFETLQSRSRSFVIAINKKISSMIKNEIIVSIGGQDYMTLSQPVFCKDRKNPEGIMKDNLTEAQFIKMFLKEETDPFKGLQVSKHLRSLYKQVVRKYRGKAKRDQGDSKKRKPLKDCAAYIAQRANTVVASDGFFSWPDKSIDDTILFKNIDGEHTSFNFRTSSRKKGIEKNALKYLSKMDPAERFGATIIFTPSHLQSKLNTVASVVASTDTDLTFAYDPVGWVGFDLNLSKKFDNWIYFSEPIFGENKVPKSLHQNIIKIEKRLSLLNSKIKIPRPTKKPDGSMTTSRDRKIKSKTRGKLRLKVQDLHEQHEKAITEARLPNSDLSIVEAYCDHVEKEKKGVALDSVKTGDSNGTFGQDKIPDLIITECQKRGIPYIVIPSYYTSRRCIDCAYIVAEYRRDARGDLILNNRDLPEFKKGTKNTARDKDTNLFTCPNCHVVHDADFVAATNHSVYAKHLYENDSLEGSTKTDLNKKWATIKCRDFHYGQGSFEGSKIKVCPPLELTFTQK